MKKLLLIFALLYLGVSNAQDPLLIDTEWFLHDLVMDGSSNTPPVIVYLRLDKQGDMSTAVCSGMGGGGTVEYIGVNEINVTELNWLAGSCATMLIDQYAFLYMDFWNNAFGIPYQYGIVSDGNIHTLTITSVEGNTAIYGNELLGYDDFSKANINFFPNPASEVINLQLPQTVALQEIQIFNIQGELMPIQSTTAIGLVKLDVSEFSSGLYFVKVIDATGAIHVSRIIKE